MLPQDNFINNDDGFQRFYDISLATLGKDSPCKINMFFAIKNYGKQLLQITKLHNNFLQIKSEENFCVSLLRKIKMRYYENLNEKSIIHNKLFWKTVKPFSSDKILDKNRIYLIKNGELSKTDLETAEILDHFFFQT